MEVEPQTEVEAQMEALKNGGKTSNGGHNPQREVEPQVEAQKMGESTTTMVSAGEEGDWRTAETQRQMC